MSLRARRRVRTFTPVGAILMSSGMMEMRLFSRETPARPFLTRHGAKLIMVASMPTPACPQRTDGFSDNFSIGILVQSTKELRRGCASPMHLANQAGNASSIHSCILVQNVMCGMQLAWLCETSMPHNEEWWPLGAEALQGTSRAAALSQRAESCRFCAHIRSGPHRLHSTDSQRSVFGLLREETIWCAHIIHHCCPFAAGHSQNEGFTFQGRLEHFGIEIGQAGGVGDVLQQLGKGVPRAVLLNDL